MMVSEELEKFEHTLTTSEEKTSNLSRLSQSLRRKKTLF